MLKSKTSRNLIAIVLGILPVNIGMIYYRSVQTTQFTLSDLIIYPLTIGVLVVVIILILNKYLLRSTFTKTFNSSEFNIYKGIIVTVALIACAFILLYISNHTVRIWFTNRHTSSTEVLDAIIELSKSPILMIIWFGPVLWIGIALFEEISRIFMLKCLWNISENKIWQYIAIILVSVLVGLTHMYQGPAGIISIGVKSLIVCFVYYKYSRILPLIITHAVYDGVQFLLLIILLKGA